MTPDRTNAYVTSEHDGEISQYAINPTTGKITPMNPAPKQEPAARERCVPNRQQRDAGAACLQCRRTGHWPNSRKALRKQLPRSPIGTRLLWTDWRTVRRAVPGFCFRHQAATPSRSTRWPLPARRSHDVGSHPGDERFPIRTEAATRASPPSVLAAAPSQDARPTIAAVSRVLTRSQPAAPARVA
jgi:hypothetical protein